MENNKKNHFTQETIKRTILTMIMDDCDKYAGRNIEGEEFAPIMEAVQQVDENHIPVVLKLDDLRILKKITEAENEENKKLFISLGKEAPEPRTPYQTLRLILLAYAHDHHPEILI